MSIAIKVPKAEYELLTRIAFLLSDATMADKSTKFSKEMNVNPKENREEADKLV